MIQNLNRLSFAGYGHILADNLPERGFPPESGWESEMIEFSGEPIQVYHLEGSKAYLDFERNMSVLAVSQSNEEMRFFYLDKPVLLDEGVDFAIVPYREKSAVRFGMRAGGVLRPAYVLEPGRVRLLITRHIEVHGIYTLFYQDKEKGFLFKGEKHELLELIYVDKGAVHNVVNGVDILLMQGEMMVYGPGQWHAQYADIDVAPSFITIAFDMTSSYLDLLINRRFKLSADAVVLLRRILEERDRDDQFSNDMIICTLQQFLLTVLRSDCRGESKLKTPMSIYNENEIVNRALANIAENVYQKLTVASVARDINISTSYLTALFHQRLQISPGEYIRRIKLEESKALIKEGRMNFTQIAEALQYSSVHHFSRQFKENFGITPTEYAKAIR